MGAFSLKFSIALGGETKDRIKKKLGGGGQKWDGPRTSITMQDMESSPVKDRRSNNCATQPTVLYSKLVSQSSGPRNASYHKCNAVVTNSARNALGYTFYKTDVTNKFKHIRWIH